MMKRVQKPERGTPSRSFKPQQSHFAPRPFPAPQPEHESSAGCCEPLFSYNLLDIPAYPRETVQPKLRLGPVGDRYEQEADRVAGQVVSTISCPEQNSVQRQEDEEYEEDGELQRKVAGIAPSGGPDVGPDLESSIQRARGSGQPLTDGVRQPMEKAFGANFGRVRLHTDGQADRVNRSIQARAFTTGQDVFFRQGEYRPGGFEGQRLLAHELTHVVQQNEGAMQQAQVQATGRVLKAKEEIAPNRTGMPDHLKSGLENISGMDLSGVRVHYNSPKPVQLNALAYTQGREIEVAPGQEKHLPHEAWHAVQQMQGRVRPTMQLKDGVPVNDDEKLEHEADVMGAKALQAKFTTSTALTSNSNQLSKSEIIQRLIYYEHTVPEFQVDGKKPGFIGDVKAMVLLVSQSRDHIIPYAAIENDLAVLLNNWIAGTGGLQELTNFTEALFPNKGPLNASYQRMLTRRNALFATLNNGTIAHYQKEARALLAALNSSTDNIRAGDSVLNSSIGENLDTDFLPGLYVVPLGGQNVNGNTGQILLPAGTQCLRLKPASEAVLWEYQTHTTQDLSFVFDPGTNTQVSSVDAPMPAGGAPAASVSGKPVIVFDPSGVGLPFYYT